MKKIIYLVLSVIMVMSLSGCSASRSYSNLKQVEIHSYFGTQSASADVTLSFSGASYEFKSKNKINFSITKVDDEYVYPFTKKGEYKGTAVVVGDIEEREKVDYSTNKKYTERDYKINVIFEDGSHNDYKVTEYNDCVHLYHSGALSSTSITIDK